MRRRQCDRKAVESSSAALTMPPHGRAGPRPDPEATCRAGARGPGLRSGRCRCRGAAAMAALCSVERQSPAATVCVSERASSWSSDLFRGPGRGPRVRVRDLCGPSLMGVRESIQVPDGSSGPRGWYGGSPPGPYPSSPGGRRGGGVDTRRTGEPCRAARCPRTAPGLPTGSMGVWPVGWSVRTRGHDRGCSRFPQMVADSTVVGVGPAMGVRAWPGAPPGAGGGAAVRRGPAWPGRARCGQRGTAAWPCGAGPTDSRPRSARGSAPAGAPCLRTRVRPLCDRGCTRRHQAPPRVGPARVQGVRGGAAVSRRGRCRGVGRGWPQ
ncbi:hypothetical protein ABH925_002982 [Streptacidiphilus sp. EB129]